MRPSVALVDDDVVHRLRAAAAPRPRASAARHLVLAGERPREPGLQLGAADRREEADAAEVDADHGHARAEEALAAPAASSRRRRARRRGRRHRAASSATSSTPPSAATRPQPRERVADRPGLPCVTTAARRTGSADGISIQRVELIGQRRAARVDEVEEELSVSLRAGQARVYDAGDPGVPPERGSTTSRSTRAWTLGSRTTPRCAVRRGPPRTAASRARAPASPARRAASAGGSAVRTRDERDVAGRRAPARTAARAGRGR